MTTVCVLCIVWLDARMVTSLYGIFGIGFGFLVLVLVLLFIRLFGFFGFKINDWPYYMYNLVDASNMLFETRKKLTRHIFGLGENEMIKHISLYLILWMERIQWLLSHRIA